MTSGRASRPTEMGVGEPAEPSLERLILENTELRMEIIKLTNRLRHAIEQRDEAIRECEEMRAKASNTRDQP